MAGIPWTPEELEEFHRLRAQRVTLRDIAARLGRSFESVKCMASRGGARPAPNAAPFAPLPAPDPIEAERERQARVRALKEERDALKDVAGEKSLRHMIESLFREIAPAVPPPPRYKALSRRNAPVRESVIMAWSDWHYGEVVATERVRGFNAYDQEIAAQRIRSIVANSRRIAASLRTGGHEFSQAVISVNGDLVTGSIHDLERHSNGKTITQSVVECGTLLAEAIRDIAADFEFVNAFGTVGNHGRMPDAKRMEQKAPTRNWDWLVYQWAAMMLRDVPNVSFVAPDSYAVGYELHGWNFLQQHGHDIKSNLGIAWYGIERFSQRMTALEASRGNTIHYNLIGHFHSAANIPHATGETFLNGSLIGGTEFSVNALGKADKPVQWLLGVHEEHGVTHRWKVYPTPERLEAAA